MGSKGIITLTHHVSLNTPSSTEPSLDKGLKRQGISLFRRHPHYTPFLRDWYPVPRNPQTPSTNPLRLDCPCWRVDLTNHDIQYFKPNPRLTVFGKSRKEVWRLGHVGFLERLPGRLKRWREEEMSPLRLPPRGIIFPLPFRYLPLPNSLTFLPGLGVGDKKTPVSVRHLNVRYRWDTQTKLNQPFVRTVNIYYWKGVNRG